TWPEPRHILANGVDDPRHVGAGDRVLGFPQPCAHQAKNVGPPAHDVPDIRMNRRCAHSNQDVIVAELRSIDVSQLQTIKRSVLLQDDRLHGRTLNHEASISRARIHSLVAASYTRLPCPSWSVGFAPRSSSSLMMPAC